MVERVLFSPGGSTEAKQDDAITVLAALLTELQQKLESGGTVALTPADVAALKEVTATISGTVTVDGLQDDALTDAELRATPVSVDTGLTIPDPQTDALTDAELRATPVPVDTGLSTQTDGLTDAELRAAPVSVDTGLTIPDPQTDALTDTELRAAPVPVDTGLTVPDPQTDALTDAELRAAPVDVSGSVSVSNQPADPATDTALQSILAELQTKIEAGQAVALDASTLAALETIQVGNLPSTYPLPLSQVQTDALTDAELRAAPVPTADADTVAGLTDLLTELQQKLESGGPVRLQAAGNDVSTLNPLPVAAEFADANGVPYDTNNRLPVDIGADLTVDNLTVEFESVASTLNVPPGPLAADEVFIGQWELVKNYASIAVALYTDQNSAMFGGKVQFSADGTNVIRQAQNTIIGGLQSYFELPPEASYFRVHYTNGPVAQTFLRSSVIYRFNPPGLVTAPLAAQVVDTDGAASVRSFLAGRLDTNTGQWGPVCVTETGQLHMTDLTAADLLTVLRDAKAPVSPHVQTVNSVVTDQALVTPAAGNALRLRKFHLHLDPSAGSNNVVTLKIGATTVYVDNFEPGLPYAEEIVLAGAADEPITISTTSTSTLYVNLRYEEFTP